MTSRPSGFGRYIKGRPVDTATVQLMQDRTADLFDTQYTVSARHVLGSLTKHRAMLTTLVGNLQHNRLAGCGQPELISIIA